MAVGPWTWFDLATEKFSNAQLDLVADTLKLVLLDNSQTIDRTFAGASTDCRYADLTGELATGSGYTNGGLTLSSKSIVLSTRTNTWSAADASWTLSGDLTFKYGAIYDDTTANKDLLCFFDSDDSSTSAETTAPSSASPLIISLSSGALIITSEIP